MILRDWQVHPYKPAVLHVDLQRISATEKLHMRIPLHFTGADVAPGVKQDGGIVAHLMTEMDITCLPKDLPGIPHGGPVAPDSSTSRCICRTSNCLRA